MVSQIKENLFPRSYFIASIAILFCFFASIWYIHKKVDKEIKERTYAAVTNVSQNNIQLCINSLKDFVDEFSFIKAIDESSSEKELNSIISHVKQTDSCVFQIRIEPLSKPKRINKYIEYSYYRRGGHYILSLSSPLNSHRQLRMEIDLMKLHQKFIDIANLNYAYVTISRNGYCLYHPDEKEIGLPLKLQEGKIERLMLSLKKDSIIYVNSEYMNIPVYRYYQSVKMGNEQWIFTANMPSLGFIESVKNTSNDFFIITLIGLVTFILVFSLELFKWRKEFFQRQEIEQKNMNLILKNEQNKRILTTAELENLKRGLNPHFLFNSLGSLRVLIDRDPDTAKTFANTLSKLYRYLLQQEGQQVVLLSEELKFTKDYIDLQSMRFPNKIRVHIAIPEKYMEYGILPVSLQLLIENCIKHTQISEDNPLDINIYVEDNMLCVINNYNPREPELGHSGKGIENLISRYSFLTDKKCLFKIIQDKYVAKMPLLAEL